jgi:iron complex transport system ATP-binding protein
METGPKGWKEEVGMLRAKGLTKRYGGRFALEGVDLRVEQGETVGLIGPNGSGKSTLVRLLCGEEKPDEGRIFLAGRELSAWSPRERAKQMAVLPQEALPPVPFTVEEVVKMGRHPHMRRPWMGREDWNVVEEVLERTGLAPARHRPVNRLSGGERQRVAIAKAMAQEPRLMILDEPTTYLDVRYQLEILDAVHRWKKQGMAILMVLHDLNLAAQYCDRLLLLKEGALVGEGRPSEVIRSDLIREVYGIEVIIIPHPDSGVPQVLLKAREERGFPAIFRALPTGENG